MPDYAPHGVTVPSRFAAFRVCRKSGRSCYGRYEIREILTAVGWLSESRRTPHQSGKIAIDDVKIECLFVTVDKAEGYRDRISCHDYAISPEIFHWQTQNNAGPDTPARRRYIESPGKEFGL